MAFGAAHASAFQPSGGNHHLSLTDPCCGKFVIFVDLDTRQLHLAGDLREEYLHRYLPAVGSGQVKDILEGLIKLADDLDKIGARHKNIVPPPEVSRPFPIGGAQMYFDGTQVFVDGCSGDLGMLMRPAIEICMASTGLKLTTGTIYVGNINRTLSSETAAEVAKAVKG